MGEGEGGEEEEEGGGRMLVVVMVVAMENGKWCWSKTELGETVGSKSKQQWRTAAF